MSTNSEVSIHLSARTDEFEAKVKRAVGSFQGLIDKGYEVSKAVDGSFKTLTKNIEVNGKKMDKELLEVERAFNRLGIKSDFTLNAQKDQMRQNVEFFKAQYNKIASAAGVSSAEVKRAFDAMNAKINYINNPMDKVAESSKKGAESMNLFGLASVAAILKIQILYSLVNSVMSAIGQMPGVVIDAVESFNSASIANAAIITSMQKGVKDVGKAYQENKRYAEAVQEVLIRMDAETAASGKNLTDMNRKFVEQGVILDINNQKQIKGFKNIANALAALTSGDSNANMQYPQEIAAMLRGENRSSNKLFQLLNGLDNGKLEEHLKLWKEHGTVFENLGNLLEGFEAAQGDINKLWSTTKSTMQTIVDEVLRKGFAPEFALMVSKMRELGEYAEKNKEKLAAMMQTGFNTLNSVVETLFKMSKILTYLAEPAMWLAIGGSVIYVTGTIISLGTAVTAASGGLNILLAALIGGGAYLLKDFDDRFSKLQSKIEASKNVMNTTLPSHSVTTNVQLMSGHGNSIVVPKVNIPTEVDDKAAKAAEKLANETANAFKEMYSDMKFDSESYYSYEIEQINKQAVEYLKLTKNEVLVTEWKNKKLKELDDERFKEEDKFYKEEAKRMAEAIDKEVKANKEAFKELKADLHKWNDENKKVSSEMSEIWKQAYQNIESYTADTFFNVMKGNYESLGDAFEDMVLRMIANWQSAQFTKGLMGDGKGDSIGGVVGSLLNWFNGSGKTSESNDWFTLPGKQGTSSWINPDMVPTGRASGGPVTAGQSYIVGEKRPELFTPGASGVITPYVPQGGSQEVKVILENKGGEKKASNARASFNPREMVVSIMLEDVMNNGPHTRALTGAM